MLSLTVSVFPPWARRLNVDLPSVGDQPPKRGLEQIEVPAWATVVILGRDDGSQYARRDERDRDRGVFRIHIQQGGVSRSHAELAWAPEKGSWVIRDLGSLNGTYIGTDEEVLLENDTSTLEPGKVTLVFLSRQRLEIEVSSP